MKPIILIKVILSNNIVLYFLVIRDSVWECLEDLNLTASLSGLDDMPQLIAQLVADTSSSYTIFAPSEGTFGLGHIINKTKPIFVGRLRHRQKLMPIDDRYTLHVSTVSSGSDRVSNQPYNPFMIAGHGT